MTECTYCPPNTKQCAHLDGRWVRIVKERPKPEDNLVGYHGEFGVFWSWPPSSDQYGFFYDTLDRADEWFQERNAKMRKLASEVPGDECT